MRILKIAGQNIASLADPFSIDLTAEPLRSAGLFAITGQTGAGKSSILDAMCLALYGDAPRLSSGAAGDEIPDAGGEAIKARDPRAILRRGANQGWAAVTFTGIDGQEYEARWTARRARDRADGRLQGVARQVARVSDGQVLASQSTHVAEQVQALTGLSYDEFRRTVLLAQGDFDAFLRADDKDRAVLLEKVTGTGLYRAISTRVFECTGAAQAELTLLTQQRDAHELLSDEARSALQAERAALQDAMQADLARRAALQEGLARHHRLAVAAAQLQQADDALSRTQSAARAADPHRARLQMIDRAEHLRLPHAALRSASVKLAEAETTLAEANQRVASATTTRDLLAIAARNAAAAHEDTEAQFRALGPLWTQATQLESRLADATHEADLAAAAAAEADQRAQDIRGDLATLQDRATHLAQDLTQAEAALASLSTLAPLSDAWDAVARDLDERDRVQAARDAAFAKLADLTRQTAGRQAQLTQLDLDDTADLTSRAALEAQAALLTDRITAIEAAAPQDRLASLTRVAAVLADLDRARRDHAVAEAALAAATAQKSEATGARDRANSAIAAAQAALDRAEAAVAALTAPAEQASLAISDTARDLRLRLRPGQPCPVCGSADHPSHADAGLAALAARLQSDLDRAHAGAAAGRDALTEARGAQAAAEARASQADRAAMAQTGAAEVAVMEWGRLLHQARALPLCPVLPDLPPPDLTMQIAASGSAVLATTAVLQDLADLRGQKDSLDRARQSLTTALDDRALVRRDLTQGLSDLARDTALSRQSGETADLRLAALDRTLSPLLATAGEGTAPGGKPRLQALVDRYRRALEARTALGSAQTALQPELARLQTQMTAASDQAQKAAFAAAQRRAAQGALRVERAGLLGGEPTEAHRSRHNQARLDQQEARKCAAQELAQADGALGLATGGQQSASAALQQAETARHTALDDLTTALAASDLTADHLDPLLDLPRAEVDGMRRHLRVLDDAVTAAVSAQTARQADLTALQAAGLPAESPADLDTALAELDTAQSARAARIGAVTSDLDRDSATRTRLSGLQGQIALAEASLQVWAAVNAAVGSASGDRFARIAQSITLDQLVDHANHHLADLNPRYRLQRAAGLALQVLDMEMGAEARATRSLSGGERFLVSLALALALSRMGDRGGLAATLFIDEGFGSLDPEALDMAIDALETLQAQGRTIGVISHVEAMKERIPVQIRVQRLGGGKSVVRWAGG